MGKWAPKTELIRDIPDFTVLTVPIFKLQHNTAEVFFVVFLQWGGSVHPDIHGLFRQADNNMRYGLFGEVENTLRYDLLGRLRTPRDVIFLDRLRTP